MSNNDESPYDWPSIFGLTLIIVCIIAGLAVTWWWAFNGLSEEIGTAWSTTIIVGVVSGWIILRRMW